MPELVEWPTKPICPHHVISSLGSSLEYLGIHRNTKTTSPLHRPEEVVLTAPDGLLGVSKRAAE